MFRFSFSEKANELFEKEFDYHRKRIFIWISFVSSIVVLLLSLNHFSQNRFHLGILNFIVSNLLLFNSIIFYRKKNILFSSILTFCFIIFTIGLSIKEQRLDGIFWSYPIVLMVHFMLHWKISLPMNMLLLVTVFYFSKEFLEGALSYKIILTLFLTLLLSHLFSILTFRIQNKMKELIVRDPLTGAYNRRQLDIMLTQAFERLKRYATLSCILAIDVDHFKSINDTYGHATGDDVLIQVVRIIQSKIRKLDSIFRIGGEEFIILLPDSNLEGAWVVAEKIRKEVEQTKILPTQTVTISIGIAEIQSNETNYQWIHRCDQLLYKAKEQGRNRCVYKIS